MKLPLKNISIAGIGIAAFLLLGAATLHVGLRSGLNLKVKTGNTSQGRPVSQDTTKQQTSSGRNVITFDQIRDSLQIFRRHNNHLGMARSYHHLGDLHNKMQNPSDALAHYLMAGNQYKQLNKTSKVIEVYHNIAVLYRQHNHFGEALHYASRAKELAVIIKNDSLIAMSNFQLGRIYEEVGQNKQAENAYGAALGVFQTYNRSPHLAQMYYHMAEVQEGLGRQNRSLNLHQKALAIRNTIHDRQGLANSYYQIGTIFAAKDDLNLAIDYHQRAANLRNDLGHSVQVAQNYIKMGEIHAKNKNFSKAMDYADRALLIANSFNALQVKIGALRLAMNTYTSMGNYDKAVTLQNQLVDLQDSVENLRQQEKRQNLAFHMETKGKVDSLKQLQKAHVVQTAQLEKEHFYLIIVIIAALSLIIILILLYNRYQSRRRQEALLLEKNDELETLNNRLGAINEEKNEIMQTVTHDMKNPLSGIIGFADLATLDAETISREKLRKLMKQIKQLAYNMDDMIKKLLDIRAIESGDQNLERKPTNLSKTLQEVVNNNTQRAGKKDLEIVMDFNVKQQFVLGDQTAIQRILDNLLSNAIKYSPRGKKIHLNMGIVIMAMFV